VRIPRAVTIPNIGVPLYIGVPRRVTYPCTCPHTRWSTSISKTVKSTWPPNQQLVRYQQVMRYQQGIRYQGDTLIFFSLVATHTPPQRLGPSSQHVAGTIGPASISNTVKSTCHPDREFFIDNLPVQILYIIKMIEWTGLAPWDFEFPFPGSMISTFLVVFLLLTHTVKYDPFIQSLLASRS